MKLRAVLTATLLWGSFTLLGQTGTGGVGMGGHGRGGGIFGRHGVGKLVTGAPYSATFVNTSVKTLSDGNTIQRTTTGSVARDSQGRTYSTETITGMFGQSGTRTITFISDPVAGFVYTLNAEAKTAIRRPMHTSNGEGPNRAAEHQSRPSNPNVVTEDRGMTSINGLSVQQKVTTRTIPAGTMGNDKPIISKTETCISPDLQIVVSSTRTDPTEGVSTYTLNNVKSTEPAATIFQVPSDYTIKDAASFDERR